MDHNQPQNFNGIIRKPGERNENLKEYDSNNTHKTNGITKIPYYSPLLEQNLSSNHLFPTSSHCPQYSLTSASPFKQAENGRNGITLSRTPPSQQPISQPKSWGIKLSLNIYFQTENFRAFTALISEYKKSISLMDNSSSYHPTSGAANASKTGAAAKAVYQNIQGVLTTAANRVETYPAYRSLREYARAKPYQTFVASTIFAFTLLPIAMFLTFVVGSFCFTFFGFILIEGTLISIATLVMGFVIFWIGSFALCIAIFTLAAYVVVSKIIRFLQQNLPSKARAQKILKSFQPAHLSTEPQHNTDF